MKKTVLLYGAISGSIITAMMVGTTIWFYKNADFEGNMALGYTAMILAFSFIYMGIKNFRDKHNDGVISFGKAFKVGLYISLVASTMYVGVWLIEYYLFIPDFMERYSALVLEKATSEGLSQAEIDKKTAEIEMFKDLYRNPLGVILLTYAEVLPLALLIALISALILKRKPVIASENQ